MNSREVTESDPANEAAADAGAARDDAAEFWRGASETAQEAQEWDQYWNSLNDSQPIFRLEARDYVDRFNRAFPAAASARVLDFGCGFGLLSAALAPHVRELVVWDSSPNMRKIAYRRLSEKNNVRFADAAGIEEDTSLGSFDYVLVNSVVQYMTFEELCNWLSRWKALIAADGRIVVSDIMTYDYSFLRDLSAFLMICLRNGVFLQSVWSGMKEIGSYSTIKSSQPLLKLDTAKVQEAADRVGLKVDILPQNLTYHYGRITAVFAKQPATN